MSFAVRYALGAIAFAGCSLINSNVTSYDLDLPAKSFSVDTSGWQVNQTSADAYLQKSCATTPTLCSTAATNACPMNCSGTCDASAHTCNLGLEISVHQTIDLLTEKPELKSVDDATTILHVTVDAMTYEVTANSLDINTPELQVYLAPMSIMDPHDPMAQQIGSIQIVHAGTTLGPTDMTFTADGQDVLTQTLANFKNPFNVIVGGTLMLHAGDLVPTGKLDANVHIKAHASL
ncbi:MAG: hypothetical protein ABI591_02725 [Kofleriaceae bacterium]